ncbi:MAG: heavy metal-binding domain-containing protein [Methanosphaera sp.]|nr:heavy metal-binding domain-containing protein [Methanosphaera sp.]
MIITTTENVPGKNYEILGLVNGNNIQSKNIVRDFTQGLRNITGGELKAYTDMMIESRGIATERMVQEAEQMGADAIVMVRYNTSSIVENSSEVHCYGTAVKFI